MEVKESTVLNEKGLFATKQYVKEDIIFTLSGKEYDHPTRETIYVGNNIHIHDQNGQYMNHSFNPTTCINNYNVVSLVNIHVGDELTFDYNKNEINMAAPFMANGIFVAGNRIL
jgi:hypothetical protein